MRYIDIAMAAMIGMSSIAGLVAWTPRTGDSMSQDMMLQVKLRDTLLAYLQQRGIVWFLQSSPSAVCADLASHSNSSVALSATIGSFSCSQAPAEMRAFASLPLRLIPYEVTLEAWPSGRG